MSMKDGVVADLDCKLNNEKDGLGSFELCNWPSCHPAAASEAEPQLVTL